MAIGGRRPLQGRKLADRRVRVERPTIPVLPLVGPGPADRQGGRERADDAVRPVLRGAKRSSSAARSPPRRRSANGCPRPRRSRSSARIAISSSTYASEEILLILVARGTRHRASPPDRDRASPCCCVVVSTSYRQICYAYPSGGGAYAVAKANINMLVRPARRGRPAVRLHDDGGRLDRSRASPPSPRSFPGLLAFRVEVWRHRDDAAHRREPPGPSRVRQHLRRPDVRLRRRGAAHDRPRPGRDRERERRRPCPTRTSRRHRAASRRSTFARRARRSPSARSPSRGPRPSPTACRRSSRPSRAMPPTL